MIAHSELSKQRALFCVAKKKTLEVKVFFLICGARERLESSATSHVFTGFKVCAVFDLLTNLLTIFFVPT